MTKKDYELLKERHEKAINRYFNLLQQFNPYTVKAKYVTCRECPDLVIKEQEAAGHERYNTDS